MVVLLWAGSGRLALDAVLERKISAAPRT
jgi:hypothetical protein